MSKSNIAGVDKTAGGRAGRAGEARWALATLSLSMLLSSLGTSIANVGLPSIASAFDATFQQVQWVVVAYLLAVTTLIVSIGRLGDLLGRRRLLLLGISLFTAASILSGLAPTLALLVAARAVQGIGAAVLMAITVALVRDSVAKERTGSAMGQLGTMSAIGTALGPSLGGVLLAGLGWRALFLVMVPLGILNVLLVLRHLPAPAASAPSARTGYDNLGTLLLGLTLAAYSLAMTVGGGRFDRLNLALLLIAACGAGLFVLAEARVASPLIRLAQFRNLGFDANLLMNALVSTVMMATLVVGPFYLARVLGLGESLVGAVMAVGPVMSALSGVPAGRVTDRFGAPSIAVIGLVAMALGSVGLSVLPAQFGTAGYVVALVVLTPGYQLFQAANNTAVMMEVAPEQRGVISGMLGLSRNLGLITGATAMGAVFASAAGASDIMAAPAEAIAAGMRATFVVAAMLIVSAIVIALAGRARTTRAASAGGLDRADEAGQVSAGTD